MTDSFIEAPTPEEVVTLAQAKFPGRITVRKTAVRRVSLTCDRDIIHPLCKYIHDVLNFEQASSVCGVDWVDHMQVVYHLSNYFNGVMIEINVDVPNDDPHIDSVALIWEGADWHERETYELFGIIFDGHPKLERLLTPQNYEFFPFRKSYKLRGQE
ncbi:MAG: NADH-quinone oxidoreductase subunit C [Methanomassiliicoccaceae archaeon]|jgi:NADH-quinone oxidoreductase subunit C|nr:NADH-quinone oxidoreductase subunit C [Methanomassiliicoccaceae archaeon]